MMFFVFLVLKETEIEYLLMRDKMIIEKYQASGNDFLISETNIEDSSVKRLCSRHYGIGSDGLIYYNPLTKRVLFFNQDGSKANLCGNGLRCLGLYLKRHYQKNSFNIKCPKNTIKIKIIDAFVRVKFLDLYWHSIPVAEGHTGFGKCYFIDIGNRHAIIIVENLDAYLSNREIKITDNVFNQKQYNLNFVQIIDKKEIKIKTYEIGVGFTLSCGSGSLASCIVLNKLSLIDDEVKVISPGGKIKIDLKNNTLMGTSEFIAKVESDL